MQIDFHHAVTYVACRLAGMERDKASIVAHAAQYVDDATNDGPLDFTDGQRYVRVTSAHKTLDIRDNGDQADNRLVWVPFHFLPGNEPTAVENPAERFIRRMVCKPGSRVARNMIADCIARQDLPFALHRFGIALHTYADTWAHQQFVGVVCDFNRLSSITIVPDPAYAEDPIFVHLNDGAMRLKAFVAGHLPVGHAAAVTYPDMPFLKWSFTRSNGETVVRDNPTDFLAAATAIFNASRAYLAGNPQLPEVDLPVGDAQVIDRMLRTTLAIDGEERHARWRTAIGAGAFSFGAEDTSYVEQGDGSWKMAALCADPDEEAAGEAFEMQPEFLNSDWKKFHDAVQYQRLFLLHDLLPRFSLSAS